jgi:hypothetical protein
MLLLEPSIDIWRFVIFLFLFYFFEMVVFKRIPQNPFIYLFIAFSVLKYANENKTRCFMQTENTLFILAFSIFNFARKIKKIWKCSRKSVFSKKLKKNGLEMKPENSLLFSVLKFAASENQKWKNHFEFKK